MLNDTRWAGAHVLAALSHGGLFLVGTFFFVFGHTGFDVPFEIQAGLPWATSAFGAFGGFAHSALCACLVAANQVTALDSPRRLYHRRQATVLAGFCVLSFFCVGDLALAVNFSDAAARYEAVSSFRFAAIMATISASLCALAFVADISKWYGQWRPDFLESLQLEENQENSVEEGLMGTRNGVHHHSQAPPAADLIPLDGDDPKRQTV